MTDNIQDKRDGLELQAALLNEQTKAVIIRGFEGQLTQYLLELLNPDLEDAKALKLRDRAIGVVDSLSALGAKISATQDMPVRRAAQRTVRSSIGEAWS